MRQNTLDGYRNGGRAPYGYQRKTEPHTNPARAVGGETKSRLVIDPDKAPVVLEIFVLWTVKELGVTAIADHLNERGHTYYRCTYGRNYGKIAAESMPATAQPATSARTRCCPQSNASLRSVCSAR